MVYSVFTIPLTAVRCLILAIVPQAVRGATLSCAVGTIEWVTYLVPITVVSLMSAVESGVELYTGNVQLP